MARDFLVACSDAESASNAERRLSSARADNGDPLFEVDNRGTDLFVMLVYGRDIREGMSLRVEGEAFEDFRRHVAFVAIKNGQHNGVGFFADTGTKRTSDENERSMTFDLAEIPDRIIGAMSDCDNKAVPERMHRSV